MLSRKDEHHENNSDLNRGWRDWWFVKYIASELPIIDGICKHEKSKDMFYYSSRSTVTLIIGTTVMMANLFDIQENNPMALKAVKMAAGMSLGMTSGMITHNCASFFIKSIQNYYQAHKNQNDHLLGGMPSSSNL